MDCLKEAYPEIADVLKKAYPKDKNLFNERNIENYYKKAEKLIRLGDYKKYFT